MFGVVERVYTLGKVYGEEPQDKRSTAWNNTIDDI